MTCYIFVQLSPFQVYYYPGILEVFFINLPSALHEFRNGQCIFFLFRTVDICNLFFFLSFRSLRLVTFLSGFFFFKLFTFTFTFTFRFFIYIVFCSSLRSSSFIYLTLSLLVIDLIRESYDQQLNGHYFHTSKRLSLLISSFDSSKIRVLCSKKAHPK